MSREPLNRSWPIHEDGDIRSWETALLCTCKQVHAEVLPVLMCVVYMNTMDHYMMGRLFELQPPHFNMLRDVELVWLVSDPSFLGSWRKDDKKGMRVIFTTKPERAKDTAISLRAICESLDKLEGLEVMKWHFQLMSGKTAWAADEAGILKEVNKARRGRQGWQVIVWDSLPWDSKVVGMDCDGMPLIQLPGGSPSKDLERYLESFRV